MDTVPSEGSSPLARGLRLHSLPYADDTGIIPARAGFTTADEQSMFESRDHPRSRGVYSAFSASSRDCRGSSPLARGLQGIRLRAIALRGIIPARAGFTRGSLPQQPPRTDHPRSRGVYPLAAEYREYVSGSSPLARGLHLAIGVIPTVGHPTRGRSPSLVT